MSHLIKEIGRPKKQFNLTIQSINATLRASGVKCKGHIYYTY